MRKKVCNDCSPKPPLAARPLLSARQAQALESTFKMLANSTRLRMLHALACTGDLCVGELADKLGMKPQAVSNQLQRLADRGIVEPRREGLQIRYSILDRCVLTLLDQGWCLAEDASGKSFRPEGGDGVMNGAGCGAVSDDSDAALLGGVAVPDFAALDELAVKLICLDSGFASPLRQMGCVLGERIAREQAEGRLTFDAALSDMISACGLARVIEARFLHSSSNGTRLQITGCSEALGWPVPQLERTVCGFDAGLFEGFLRGTTGEGWKVEEMACLGLGHPSCEFVIHREQGGEAEGGQHGRR